MSWRRLLARLGGVIFAFGILVLLFVAYQLWSTGISTRVHQEVLRKQFNHALAIARSHRTTSTTSITSQTSTTTARGPVQPIPGGAPADGQPIGTIAIPNIGVNLVIVQGTSTADLELGPGHYANTSLPGHLATARSRAIAPRTSTRSSI